MKQDFNCGLTVFILRHSSVVWIRELDLQWRREGGQPLPVRRGEARRDDFSHTLLLSPRGSTLTSDQIKGCNGAGSRSGRSGRAPLGCD